MIPEKSWNQNRDFETNANQQWDQTVDGATLSVYAVNELRLLTTINNPTLRREFYAKFQKRFPEDRENGCPSDRPPPATIVTQDGDVPLTGHRQDQRSASIPPKL